MKITQSTPERLVIKDFPWGFGLIFALMGGGLVYVGGRALLYNPGMHKAEGVFALAGAIFLLSTAVFTRRSVFVFDLTRQELTWSHASLFGVKSGTMALGRITGCVVQVLETPRAAPTFRLVLASPDGDLPLTDTYSTSTMSARQKLRDAIHTALRLPPPDPESTADIERLVKSLIVAGQEIAAIKLVRDQQGSSLLEAKDYVEALKGHSESISTK